MSIKNQPTKKPSSIKEEGLYILCLRLVNYLEKKFLASSL